MGIEYTSSENVARYKIIIYVSYSLRLYKHTIKLKEQVTHIIMDANILQVHPMWLSDPAR